MTSYRHVPSGGSYALSLAKGADGATATALSLYLQVEVPCHRNIAELKRRAHHVVHVPIHRRRRQGISQPSLRVAGYLLVACGACSRAVPVVSPSQSDKEYPPPASRRSVASGLSCAELCHLPLPMHRRGVAAAPFAIHVASSVTSSAAQHVPIAVPRVQGTRAQRRIRIMES